MTDFKCGKCGKPLVHIHSKEKGWDFFACSDREGCGAKYDNVDGKPVANQRGLTDIPCPKCGEKLKHLKGAKDKNGNPYDFFLCSSDKCKATFSCVDGKPVERSRGEKTDFHCPKCQGALLKLQGKKAQYLKCAECGQIVWIKDDGTPDFEKLPENKRR